MKLLCLLTIAMTLVPASGLASDYAREQRWAEQIVDAILDGEPVQIKNGDREFLGIFTETEQDQQRAVIIMHGTGVHPDWQQVIYPLRVGLIQHGWHTLSIQMPILHKEAEYPEYAALFDHVAPRINAAIHFLKENGVERIVPIGHSMGAAMGAYYMSQSPRDVDGFVGIGFGSFKDDPRMNVVNTIEKIHDTPVLDLYGSEDLESILADVPARAAAAKKAGNSNYRQIAVPGANHMFDDKNEKLVEVVADWLEKL